MAFPEPTDTTGPRGRTEPANRWARRNFEDLPERRRTAVTAAARTLWRARTHTPAKAWDAALDQDWRTHITVADEDTFSTLCTPVLGGGTHTAHPRDHDHQAVHPLCRTMDRNQRLTRYRITTGEITCRTCLEQRARRAEVAPCACCHDTPA
ncbi:hypothetical protein OG948_58670 (plasmid) [Embleya sp. NBC_00888]|uniref:hypothetical protein n=1 Tax=Embleya sp. NBC_00888 TaxID=2975960 RepID=UPI002F9160E4|nr:hypothetical protein OG948_58670 [Embleya sp. NBC_00888]